MKTVKEKTKCPRCRCLCEPEDLKPGSEGALSCSKCKTRKRGPSRWWESLKADPEKLAARNKERAEERKRNKEEREQRYRIVEVQVIDEDLEYDDRSPEEIVEFEAQKERNRQIQLKKDEKPQRLKEMRLLYESGASSTEVAKRFGLNPGVTYNLLAEAGTLFRDRGSATSAAMLGRAPENTVSTDTFTLSPDVIQKYLLGASISSIAKMVCKSYKTVQLALKRAGVPIRSSKEQWDLMFRGDTESQ